MPSRRSRALRLKLLGNVLYRSAAPVGLATFFGIEMCQPKHRIECAEIIAVGLLALAVLMLLLHVGLRLLHRGRSMLTPLASELLANDQRAPVLYLRSFRDDQATHRSFDYFYSRMGYYTEEEELAKVFDSVGPFVAVGEPGETLPALGAARFYFDSDSWKAGVVDLIAQARFVILRASNTPGLLWELQHVIETVPPDRLLLVVGSRQSYAAFAALVTPFLPHPLPTFSKGSLLGSMRGFIAFDDGFHPRALPLRRSCVRWTMTHPYLAELTLALRPVLTEQGLPWHQPKLPWLKILALAALVVSIVVNLSW